MTVGVGDCNFRGSPECDHLHLKPVGSDVIDISTLSNLFKDDFKDL
eukprot:CAMPEP_0197255246 /NCGR_PEP_ID=MMETSP1429-20130617/71498_1 /TAXON_ID=49237 /ORGANISM="Chaetoceros  sp., Strain UNC1202" /LENGTH=45 /DNA_ID= /DNA_START= /DNA_END= /DNA_ORIENTATION=